MNKPLVSVIMITYAHEKFIAEAIHGVLMQQCDFDVEVIIADDRSPDGTEAIIREILKNTPTQHAIHYTRHEQNKGMMPNFLWAMNQTTGTYITVCEGDDYWTDPLKLQKQVDLMERNKDISLCFTKANLFDEKAQEVTGTLPDISEPKIGLTEFLLINKVLPTATFLYRDEDISRDIMNTLGPQAYFGDGLLTLSAFIKPTKQLYFMDEVTSVYRVNVVGSSTYVKKEIAFIENQLMVLKKAARYFTKTQQVAINKGVVFQYIRLANLLCDKRLFAQCFIAVLRGLFNTNYSSIGMVKDLMYPLKKIMFNKK